MPVIKSVIYSYNWRNNQNSNKESRSRKRKRNVMWFNPPKRVYECREILPKLGKQAFPHNNENLKKIFNRNNVKVSYSCMPNIRGGSRGGGGVTTVTSHPPLSEQINRGPQTLQCPINSVPSIRPFVRDAFFTESTLSFFLKLWH